MAFPFYTQPKKENRSGTAKKKFLEVQSKTTVLAHNKYFGLNASEQAIILPTLEYFSEIDSEGLNSAVSPDEIYSYITDLIINTINKVGHLPWQKEWIGSGAGGSAKNYVSKKEYTGANFILNFDIKHDEDGKPYLFPIKFINPFYLTFNQITEAKATLKKGSKARRVIYYTLIYDYKSDSAKVKTTDKTKFDDFVKTNALTKDDLRKNLDTIPVLKYYNIFRADDCTGLKFESDKTPEKVVNPIEEAQTIIDNYSNPPTYTFVGDKAFYQPSGDLLNMPKITAFSNEAFYYCTFFHELTHSTGAEKRLNRDFSGTFGSKNYAYEELIAELGAVFLCSHAGILFSTKENSAKYLKSWNKKLVTELENDNRFFLKASAQAQKAVNWILWKNENKEVEPATKNKLDDLKKTVARKPRVDRKKTGKQLDLFAGLNASRHKGIAKIGLSECGRLKKGFKYKNGEVVKAKSHNGSAPEKPKAVEASKAKTLTATKPKTVITSKPSEKKLTKNSDVFNISISEIQLDKARFQNRNQLNETVLNQIVENYSATKLDPVIVWIDSNKKTYLLAGHHRFEATKRVGKKTIPAKYFTGSESEAIRYAKIESNANRSLELPQERAKIYREMFAKGTSKANVLSEAKKLEGKNANYIVNLSFLNPNGLTIQALDQLSDTPDKQNETLIVKIADWTGEARRNNEKLTNAHEKEIFDFLQDKNSSERIKTKADFLQKIVATTGMFFDYETALNLKKFKYETQGEAVYNQEYKELQIKVETAINNKQNLIDRIKNPQHKDFINPKDKDYTAVIGALEKAIEKYNSEIKAYQSKLITLTRNKGSYLNAGSNQAGLFGSANSIDTEKFKKMTVSELRKFTLDFYNQNLKGKKVAIKNHLKEVLFTTPAGRKIAKGGSMYKEKSAVIESLEVVIKNSTYNNWGERKENDSLDVLGFLNFKSKLIIDGQKRHIRISIELRKNRKTTLKNVEVGENKKSLPSGSKRLPAVGGSDNLKNKDNNNNTKKPNLGLNSSKPSEVNKNSLAYKMANQPKNVDYFNIPDKNISRFLGKIEKKTKESVFISLTGGQGSMKTRMAFQLMNVFAQNYKVGHASIEEHPESVLYFDKAKQYLNTKAQQNISNPEVNTLSSLHKLIIENDVIVIDSFTKMKEIEKTFEVDRDLRKKYNGKLFIVIFQQTTDGSMRGGSKSQFDADIVLFTEKFDDYTKNYVFSDKNRYNSESGLKFNIYKKQLVQSEIESSAVQSKIKKLSFNVN